ncbi:MAG: DUF5054 domain-containing protein [Acidobacteriota bacterium]
MNRREFTSRLAGGLALARAGGASAQPAEPDSGVTRVLVMFKCHFDAGFVDTQAAILRRYFTQHFPLAIRTANALRQAGGEERYVWTTGSWLLYEYLEQAGPADRQRMERAIAQGDIAWHALPFTWQTELLDPSAITGALGFSKSLDRRFGRTTTGAKMTDVPGHTRGLIAPLAASGVTFLDIGVNAASTPPDVPPLFVWKDPAGASIVMMYHRLEYGGVVRVPQSDVAVAVEVRDDNLGPHTREEIHRIYAELRRRFPKASIQASNLTEIAHAVQPHRASLPVLTQEIGDTWIYGVASDPVKLARFREVLRLRTEWIGQGKLQPGDKTDLAFLARFALGAEHTWGTDTKTWLDFDHYTPDALASMLDQPKYRTVTGSWVEKRADIDQGIAALPPALRGEALARVAALKRLAPATSQLQTHDASTAIEAAHFTIGLDPATGAITRLRGKSGNRDWASAEHPLAAFSYQTLSKADYDRFLASYITVQTDWAPKDFGKPNIESFGALSRIWNTRLTKCMAGENAREHRIVAHLRIENGGAPASPVTAWPADLYLELVLPKAEPVVYCNLTWFGKRANRLPEAMWLSFHPAVRQERNWLLSKSGGTVSPFDVVSRGNRHMHALSGGLSYKDERGTFTLDTLDAPLVVLGERSPIFFSNAQPDLSKGFHFSLFNNGWGTNYVQWFGEDMRYRFVLKPGSAI